MNLGKANHALTSRASVSVQEELKRVQGLGDTIAVRAAKSHFSALLDWVAQGHEVVVTSGGVAKARLAPIESGKQRKVFLGAEEHLKSMPPWSGGPTADEIIREDRDSRGW